MKIRLIQAGKTGDAFLREGIALYETRLKHYVSFQTLTLPAHKNTRHLSGPQQRELEGRAILDCFEAGDRIILLDEKGKQFSSRGFAGYLNTAMINSVPRLVFVIGGPYGFSDTVYEQAHEKLSFSKMTFSHQMIRLFFTEQLYRAFTILRGEPYHND